MAELNAIIYIYILISVCLSNKSQLRKSQNLSLRLQ